MKKLPIKYREFHDVPRIFLVHHGEQLYLFDCPFDSEIDEYPSSYQIYEMPPLLEEELNGSWEYLYKLSKRSVGNVPIEAVNFDESKRREIDAAIFDSIAA